MRKLYLTFGSIAALFAALPAVAQTPSQFVVTAPQRAATYSSSIATLAPAASATDFFTIVGSATTVVRVKKIGCTGVSTADGSAIVSLIKRSTANATGTSTSPAITPHDSILPAATAVVKAYTVNPGTLGTAVGTPLRVGLLGTRVAATAAGENGIRWDFGLQNDTDIVLRGVAQTLAMNNAGASFVAGAALSCTVEWTESPA